MHDRNQIYWRTYDLPPAAPSLPVVLLKSLTSLNSSSRYLLCRVVALSLPFGFFGGGDAPGVDAGLSCLVYWFMDSSSLGSFCRSEERFSDGCVNG